MVPIARKRGNTFLSENNQTQNETKLYSMTPINNGTEVLYPVDTYSLALHSIMYFFSDFL